jgi:hypothetical protein
MASRTVDGEGDPRQNAAHAVESGLRLGPPGLASAAPHRVSSRPTEVGNFGDQIRGENRDRGHQTTRPPRRRFVGWVRVVWRLLLGSGQRGGGGAGGGRAGRLSRASVEDWLAAECGASGDRSSGVAEIVTVEVSNVLPVFGVGEELGVLLDHAVDGDDMRPVTARAFSSLGVPFSRRQKTRSASGQAWCRGFRSGQPSGRASPPLRPALNAGGGDATGRLIRAGP